jgi:hypothetical protein
MGQCLLHLQAHPCGRCRRSSPGGGTSREGAVRLRYYHHSADCRRGKIEGQSSWSCCAALNDTCRVERRPRSQAGPAEYETPGGEYETPALVPQNLALDYAHKLGHADRRMVTVGQTSQTSTREANVPALPRCMARTSTRAPKHAARSCASSRGHCPARGQSGKKGKIHCMPGSDRQRFQGQGCESAHPL